MPASTQVGRTLMKSMVRFPEDVKSTELGEIDMKDGERSVQLALRRAPLPKRI